MFIKRIVPLKTITCQNEKFIHYIVAKTKRCAGQGHANEHSTDLSHLHCINYTFI